MPPKADTTSPTPPDAIPAPVTTAEPVPLVPVEAAPVEPEAAAQQLDPPVPPAERKAWDVWATQAGATLSKADARAIAVGKGWLQHQEVTTEDFNAAVEAFRNIVMR